MIDETWNLILTRHFSEGQQDISVKRFVTVGTMKAFNTSDPEGDVLRNIVTTMLREVKNFARDNGIEL